MARRRDSGEDILRALGGLAIFLFVLCAVNPAFKQALIRIGLLIAVVLGLVLVGLAVFMIVRWRRRSTPFIQPRVVDLQTLEGALPEPAHEPARQPLPPPAPISPTAALEPAKASAFQPPPLRRVTADDLREVDWFQFEKIVALLYESRGWRVEHRGGANPDGGIDLVVYKDEEKLPVQIKQWHRWKVRENHIRDFLGGMVAQRFERGHYVMLGDCTDPARDFALANGIAIIGFNEIKTLLDRGDPRTHELIRDIVDDRTKHCPKCGAEMVLRTAERGPNAGSNFWGCSKYPRCHGIIELTK